MTTLAIVALGALVWLAGFAICWALGGSAAKGDRLSAAMERERAERKQP
jgi:hypothetical protein